MGWRNRIEKEHSQPLPTPSSPPPAICPPCETGKEHRHKADSSHTKPRVETCHAQSGLLSIQSPGWRPVMHQGASPCPLSTHCAPCCQQLHLMHTLHTLPLGAPLFAVPSFRYSAGGLLTRCLLNPTPPFSLGLECEVKPTWKRCPFLRWKQRFQSCSSPGTVSTLWAIFP